MWRYLTELSRVQRDVLDPSARALLNRQPGLRYEDLQVKVTKRGHIDQRCRSFGILVRQ